MKAFRIQIFLVLLGFIFYKNDCVAQIKKDSVISKIDSLLLPDSVSTADYRYKNHITSLDSFLKRNKYINTTTPFSLIIKQKAQNGKEFLFYLLSIVIFLLALFKMFYAKYFNNIFRVFFNTSLRQNQLTDLLLQSKLPSLLLNILFVVSAGLYLWLLLNHYHMFKGGTNYAFIALSILFIGMIYIGKFLSLKLIGWISGMTAATDQYIFVIFLINKIIAIFLIPFIILLSFAPDGWINVIIVGSVCIIGILFLLRYLRSYGLLQSQLKINRFHFLLYIIGIEILPFLIIYKLLISVLQ